MRRDEQRECREIGLDENCYRPHLTFLSLWVSVGLVTFCPSRLSLSLSLVAGAGVHPVMSTTRGHGRIHAVTALTLALRKLDLSLYLSLSL